VLALALTLSAGANMSAPRVSTLSGAGIGMASGLAVGAITGDCVRAAAGAAMGAGKGGLTVQQRRRQWATRRKAFEAGVQAGKQQAQKNRAALARCDAGELNATLGGGSCPLNQLGVGAQRLSSVRCTRSFSG